MRLYLLLIEDLAQSALNQLAKAGVPFGRSMLARVTSQKPRRLQFVRIAQVLRPAAGQRDQPCPGLSSDRRLLARPGTIVERRHCTIGQRPLSAALDRLMMHPHGPPLEPIDASAASSGPTRKRLAFTAAYALPEEGRALEQGLLFISEPNVALQIRLGALCVRYRDGGERTFPRGRHRVQSIILASPGASVTIEAMRFAMDEGITILVMHRAGEALALLTDAPTMNTTAPAMTLRRAQFSGSPRQRLDIARAILTMKIEACELPKRETRDALRSVSVSRDHAELLITEALAAKVYWAAHVGFRPHLASGRTGVRAIAVFQLRVPLLSLAQNAGVATTSGIRDGLT